MAAKARQMRGSLRKLVHHLTSNDPVVRELLETAIQDTVTSIHTGKDHKWVARKVEAKCDQVFDHRERY